MCFNCFKGLKHSTKYDGTFIMQLHSFLFDRDTINSIKNTLPCMRNISNQCVTDSFDLNSMMSYLKILHEHYAAILTIILL